MARSGQASYFRGVCDEDYMADAETPYSWRCRRDMAGLGALRATSPRTRSASRTT